MRTIFHRTVSNTAVMGIGDSVDLFDRIPVFLAYKYAPFNSFRIVNNSIAEAEIRPEGSEAKTIKCPIGITTIPAIDNYLIYHPWLYIAQDKVVGVGEISVEIDKVVK